MQKDCIYLDYASTHPRKKEIMALREQFELTSYANIGRGNYDLAEASMIAYQNSKKSVARWIGCEPVEVIYTYSATYAINILALAIEQNGVLQQGDTILLSVSEHHANIVPWQMIAQRVGAQVQFVNLDTDYCIDLGDLKSKFNSSVKVVSLQYGSNVTGAIHPLEKVRDIIGPDVLFCVDASQMVLRGPVSMKDIHCDALVFSGHKMMADTGIGVLALWKVLQKSWQAPIGGGGAINSVSEDGYEQAGIPERWEPGTPHITGAVTLGAAIEYLETIDTTKREKYAQLVELVTQKFIQLAPKGVQVFHSNRAHSLGVWSFVIPGKHPNDIADMFSEEGICLRSGHHCCEPLHTYLGLSGSVRMSIGFDTTSEEVERFFAVLESFL
ncbi:aminotransferase class V-fold PLP-dependent enzyme [Candidatus Gracilibacteria bacterium]|nr:aminotransferase class V-fold PLP-dependent enzyme [Candidatus Gracilibacteria bacterium]